MYRTLLQLVLLACVGSVLSGCGGSGGQTELATKEALGKRLFFESRLSLNQTQSCATCHNPDHAFIDNRVGADQKIMATSLGDDGTSRGDRNAPTAGYALFSPEFHWGRKTRFNSQQSDYEGFLGGQFLDGRQPDLKGQAGQPPLNPVEMNLPSKAVASERIQEVPEYVTALKALYGEDIFADPEQAFAAMADAIGEFEKTEFFAPFSSKYDKSLRGEYFYSPLGKAAAGKALFFSQQFTNCATCHQLNRSGSKRELFTSFEYHNIGVPVNMAVRNVSGQPPGFVDEGLYLNPQVDSTTERGKFKVPSLRNTAVTEPYMHNGIFRDLKTVIEFYDHFLEGSVHTLNPETNQPWAEPEVPENLALTELKDGRLLDEDDIEALVCFIRTLTDERYEHLIQDKGIDCGDD